MLSKEIRLRRRPVGLPQHEDFALATAEVDTNAEVIVRIEAFSVDPYMRSRMIDRKSYLAPFELNEPMLGAAVGRVIHSKVSSLKEGDYVTTMLGWREVAAGAASEFQKIDGSLGAPIDFLNRLGTPGLTAWAGLHKVARIKAGDSVFVSAASGAVGSIACQLAKLNGCYVVGSAGSSEKCAWLMDVAGIDAAINYNDEDLGVALARKAPQGIDVYFENVGGAHLEAALDALNTRGRIAVCGMIAQYNDVAPRPGPSNLGLIIQKTLRVEGFLVSQHFQCFQEYRAEMSVKIRDGQVRVSETVVSRIENAIGAFLSLFSGDKMGKIIVKL